LAVPVPTGQSLGVPPLPTASMTLRGKRWLALVPGGRPAVPGSDSSREAAAAPGSRRFFAAAAALAQGAAAVAAEPPTVSAPLWQALIHPPVVRAAERGTSTAGSPASSTQASLPPPALAVVADPTGPLLLGPSAELSSALVTGQLVELTRAGVAYDVWLLGDCARRSLRGRRAYLFLTPFQLDKRQREDVSFLKDRQHLLLFSYAAGAIRPGTGINGREIFGLTGVHVTSLRGGKPLRVKALAGVEPWTASLRDDVVYGTRASVSPWFGCLGSGGEVLGYLEGTRLPGLVAGQHDSWSSVYSAAPGLPAPLLQSLATAAGAETCCRGKVRLAAGSGIVALWPEEDEAVEVRFPAGLRVLHLAPEGWTEQPRATSTAGLKLQARRGEPLIFSLQPLPTTR
ncbi:MAG: hypothetical protein J7M26_04185, partial [Armatimonadetes bacterium]|nr:hypothetical protein [Armatimonadota bacterium]